MVAVPHEKIVNLLATSVGEVCIKDGKTGSYICFNMSSYAYYFACVLVTCVYAL